MSLTRVSKKGQITIPRDVREALGLRSGDRVEIVVEGGKAILKPLKKSPEEVYGKLSSFAKKAVSVEEMDQGIRKKLKQDWEKS